MGTLREVDRYFVGKMGQDGAGVKLRRCFGYSDIPDFDPFLMMDFFDSENPDDYTLGFPWHPHRGIETITYLIHGEIEHEDSLGNKGIIKDGDCQWMRAGSGILHQEMPKENPIMLGTQIWLNMSQDKKMISPEYQDITSDMIPIVEEDNLKIHIIAGQYKNIKGPIIDERTQPIFMDIEMGANSEFIYELDENLNTYGYLLRGRASFNPLKDEYLEEGNGVLFKKGNIIKIKSKDANIRFFLIAGMPLKEDIAWGGPIVMNSKEELNEAFKELDEGTFIK